MPTNIFDLEAFLKALVIPEDIFRLNQCERIGEKDIIGFYAHFVPGIATVPTVAGLEMVVEAVWIPEQRILRFSTYPDLSTIDTDTEEDIQKLLWVINNCNATLDILSKVFVSDQDEEIVATVNISFIIPAEFDINPAIQQGFNLLAGHSVSKLITDTVVVSMHIHEEMNVQDGRESESQLQ